MPKLPDTSSCCGCAACVDVCNKQALSLKEDHNGFYNIVIDQSKCVDCHLCENKCHILNQEKLQRHDPHKVQPLAGWSKSPEIIRNSATGGIFTQIAYNMLSEGNTYVYGAALQGDSSVRHIEISRLEDLYKLQNSKYQQSYSVGIYKQAKLRLQEGARVLFSGVPCQIAALYSYLGNKKEFIDNLYTIEVICHGVPTNELHRTALRLNGAERVSSYRNKKGKGWLMGANNRLSYIMSDGSEKIVTQHRNDFLFRSYLSFSFSRKNCHTCKYSTLKRVSDLTIGDFWGWEKTERYDEYGNVMGTSVIFPNSDKGFQMINTPNFHTVDASWKDIFPLNQNLYMPTNQHMFLGGEKVHIIKKLPLFLQKFIYMNGFSGSLSYRIYEKLFDLLTIRVRRKKIEEKNLKCKEALKELGL